ncbi:MAG: glycosyl transferase [Clostridia bacterium]|nr:glycosyl transferase [Clostridia bacterium]MBR3592473.1 glycosyl transferase [Clostridia bacterium]
MIDYRNIIKNREVRLKLIKCLRFIPTKLYLKMVYRIKTGKKLNLKNPTGFNEKLNWLKVNDIHFEYSKYVDKVLVRDFIKEKIGEDYLIPLLGVWDKFDDIDFDNLPEKFVLKCNHDSGSVKIITDKKSMNIKKLRKFFNGRLNINSYWLGREFPYKEVKRKIIAQEFLSQEEHGDLTDYKFFCFNGEPYMVEVLNDKSTDMKSDLFDMNFERIDARDIYKHTDGAVSRPVHFEQMKEIAKTLSEGFKFVRIDLFETNNKVYYAEHTFFNNGGFWLFEPDEWEQKLGELINLDV